MREVRSLRLDVREIRAGEVGVRGEGALDLAVDLRAGQVAVRLWSAVSSDWSNDPGIGWSFQLYSMKLMIEAWSLRLWST